MAHIIRIDSENRFIDAKIMGLLEVKDVQDYVRELTAKFAAAFPAGGPYVMLIDITECALQSMAVVDAFRTHIANFPKASRLAIVSGSSMARFQLQQILVRPYLRFFYEYREAAKVWLLELEL